MTKAKTFDQHDRHILEVIVFSCVLFSQRRFVFSQWSNEFTLFTVINDHMTEQVDFFIPGIYRHFDMTGWPG